MRCRNFNDYVRIISLASLASFSSPAASFAAGGPSNIDGLSSRLELARCRSAHLMNWKEFQEMGEASCASSGSDKELVACLKAELAKVAGAKVDAVLEIRAIPGQKNMNAAVVADNKSVFQSTVRGYHADSDRGPTLSFYRAGSNGNDPYQIDFLAANDDTPAALGAIVPMRVQGKPDAVYVFTDGCTLTWESR